MPNYCGIFGLDSVNICVYDPTKVNVTFLITQVNLLAAYDLIDPVANIQGDKVFIFHGQKDTAVFPGINIDIVPSKKYTLSLNENILLKSRDGM